MIDIQKQLLPDLLEIMQKRYHILQSIRFLQPVGRRSLSGALGLTERVLRSEVDFLKNQDLIAIKAEGMSITEEGFTLLLELEGVMREISGINVMEQKIKKQFMLQEVVIVPGESDESLWVKEEMGRATTLSMKKRLEGNNIIAVTGGSTMATVAEMLTARFSENEILFVPARGGIGEDVKNQANTICAQMAEVTGAKHRVLYVPDQVSKEVYHSLMKEPDIREVMNLITSANIVLHGIGEAISMAKRRRTNEEDIEKITFKQAVGEAFGYYFNEQGEVVHKVPTIGLQLRDLANIPNVFAVAGGTSKAKAIRSYLKSAPSNTVLITDEGAAKELLKG